MAYKQTKKKKKKQAKKKEKSINDGMVDMARGYYGI
jgi:hypothetical protein